MSEEMIPFQFKSIGWCVDDVKGGELLLDLLRAGRKAEIEECAARKGHEIRPRMGSKPRRRQRVLGFRSVDTLKVCEPMDSE